MKFINTLKDGDSIRTVYLCKTKRTGIARNGKSYETLTLQDKTGTLDGKIWDPASGGIGEFEEMDFVEIYGDIRTFNNALQLNIKQIRKANEDEYSVSDYLSATDKDVEKMYAKLLAYADSVENKYLHRLLDMFFREDKDFTAAFKERSAARSVHHSYMGGLLEHTLAVTRLCEYLASAYPVLNRNLLIAAAIFHDIGKVNELSPMPQNEYTDDGQLLGHIVIGAEMIDLAARKIDGFPPRLESELKHCILSHHGEFEFGSPKKPALPEAVALHYADNIDAKMQTLTEFTKDKPAGEWLGFNKLFDSNIRKSTLS